ncbi:MAG TPA: AAA family ATPase [Candidatus Thermoplasmatota archaeon]|nr:AAA family ATPase [Candidatus Thermoplasmatota archaeon]
MIFHLVAVAGLPGTGTTTLSKLLAERLKLPHVYAGALFRRLAAEKDMTLAEFGEFAENHPEIDTELDRRMIEVARKGGVVLEGRMVAWQCKEAGAHALKILLEAPEHVRAQRVADREKSADVDAILRENRHREASEAKRYREIYGVDPNDPRLYDLVLESGRHLPDALADAVEARWRGGA